MSHKKHTEHHFEAPEMIKDIIIGAADGLTVPFALAAGLAGSMPTTHLIVVAGFSEIAAGMIAMGLGGYLAAKHDREHYLSELKREHYEMKEMREKEQHEIEEIVKEWGIREEIVPLIVEDIMKDEDKCVDFMMKHELGLYEEPEPKRARNSSLTIGISYLLGGFIPLAPYIFISKTSLAQMYSVIITLLALFVFGFVKGKFTGSKAWSSAIEMTIIGGIAATVAFLAARFIL